MCVYLYRLLVLYFNLQDVAVHQTTVVAIPLDAKTLDVAIPSAVHPNGPKIVVVSLLVRNFLVIPAKSCKIVSTPHHPCLPCVSNKVLAVNHLNPSALLHLVVIPIHSTVTPVPIILTEVLTLVHASPTRTATFTDAVNP